MEKSSTRVILPDAWRGGFFRDPAAGLPVLFEAAGGTEVRARRPRGHARSKNS